MPWRRGTTCLFAIAAAVAAFASFATASASATNLCSVAPNGANECPAGNAYAAGQVFEATSPIAGVETEGLGVVVCEESTLKFKVTEILLGFAAQAELQTFSFENCEHETGEEFNLTFSPLPAKVQILQTGGGNGEFFIQPKGGAVIELANEAFAFKFSAKELTGKFTGGNPATVLLAGTFEGGAAGALEFKGTYSTTNPKPLWATK